MTRQEVLLFQAVFFCGDGKVSSANRGFCQSKVAEWLRPTVCLPGVSLSFLIFQTQKKKTTLS